jgi:hypothetical protein
MKRIIKWIIGLVICIIGILTTPILVGIYIFAIGAALMEDE